MTKLIVVTSDSTAVALQSLATSICGLEEDNEVIAISEPTVFHATTVDNKVEVTASAVVELD